MSRDLAEHFRPRADETDFDRWLEAAQESDPMFDGAMDDAECRAALIRRLAACRAELHLSQTAVAKLMETTQSAVSELEGGLTDPRLSTLQRYARAVNCAIQINLQPARHFLPINYGVVEAVRMALPAGRPEFHVISNTRQSASQVVATTYEPVAS